MGAMESVEAAESLAQNNPSGLENDAVNTVRVAAFTVVKFKLQKASFQQRMIDRRAVARMPGAEIGRTIRRTSSNRVAPSIRPASRITDGISWKNENNIHTTIGNTLRPSITTNPKIVSSRCRSRQRR